MAENDIGFQFKARVLLELGAELISSDAVALVELVKNSLDAQSKSVKIAIDVSLPYTAYMQLSGLLIEEAHTSSLHGGSHIDLEVFNEALRQQVEEAGGKQSVRDRFFEKYGSPRSLKEAQERLANAYLGSSRILVQDTGAGMSASDLRNAYMTVGTPSRRAEKDAYVKQANAELSRLHFDHSKRVRGMPLGEKGIGRLAAMRLGHYVKVTTKRAGEKVWNVLVLDWREAFSDVDLDASGLKFKLDSTACEQGEVGESGTKIEMFCLQGDWSAAKVRDIARYDLAKLADPFADFTANNFVRVTYQGAPANVPILDREPLRFADAVCEAKYSYDAEFRPSLRMHVDYKHLKSEWTDTLVGEHLRSSVREEPSRKAKKTPLVDGEIIAAALQHLGPWEMKFYWFNRGRLMRENSTQYEGTVRDFLQAWGGGFIVYRDGYRVYPYGERSDDWLDLDRKALSSSAYKLNRAQMVGYLRISSIANPTLLDQTNREGFRNSYEKEALRRLLRYVILGFCKPFLEDVERKKEKPIEEVVEEVEGRLSTSKEAAITSLKAIKGRVPSEAPAVGKVMAHLEEVTDAWERAKLRIESFEEEMERYMHLAGVGLMLEFIAHELARITQDTLKAVSQRRFSPQVIEAQLKTLDRRVRLLDELSVPGRQRRREEDIQEVVTLLTEFHQHKAARDSIEVKVLTVHKGAFREHVEKGQILQILDNLMSNSFYWLNNRLDSRVPAEITITLDKSKREIRFTDNGPGIPTERSELVFDQFFTTKPPQAGRGLGLYIARRLAEENKASLTLAPADVDGNHRTFVLKFGAVQ